MPVRITAVRQRKEDWAATGEAQLAAAQKAFIESALSQLQRYPPPNSTYIRTGNLGRSWTGHTTPEGASVTNPVRYSSYVQGPTTKSRRSGGQTTVMASKGWLSITDAGKKAAADAKKAAEGVTLVTRNYGTTG